MEPAGQNNYDDEHFHDEEEHIEDEGEVIWLLSYADLMTLLFVFFVLMYSMATTDVGDSDNVRQHLASYFGGKMESKFDSLEKEIMEAIKNEEVLQDIQMKLTLDGLELTFTSTVLFNSGEAKLLPHVRESLDRLVSIIHGKSPDAKIKVEGHTDDRPIQSTQFPSNWELSGARASTIIRLFQERGFDASILTAIGYGEARPMLANRTPAGEPIPENMAKNRRVVIKVLAPEASSAREAARE